MKTFMKSAAMALIFAAVFSVSSCKKEEGSSATGQNNSSGMSASSNQPWYGVNETPYGHNYEWWSGQWWKWGMERDLSCHPFNSGCFNVTDGQSGSVWFLAGVFGPPAVTRAVTIPSGVSLMIAVVNAEWSSLEDPFPTTESAQRSLAKSALNGAGVTGLFCTIDGQSVSNLGNYQFYSPQFSFSVPTPWIFSSTGGAGTSVGDGYYVMVKPLSTGAHVIHFGGTLSNYGASIDMTYNISVQ